MSQWSGYIDTILGAGFMYATINSHSGDLWASSPGFVVSAEEISLLAEKLANDDIGDLATNGFTIAGQKYTFTRGENQDDDDLPSFVQGRCKEAEKSSQGVVIFRTHTALIVGVHDPSYSNGASFGAANTEMGRTADYMWENNY